MAVIKHPLLPFEIEYNEATNQCIRRYNTGAVEAVQPVEYIIGLLLVNLVGENATGVLEAIEGLSVQPLGEKLDSIEQKLSDLTVAVAKLKSTTKKAEA